MGINRGLSNLQVNKLTPNIGAEIICKNVFEDLSPNICNEIYKYLIENKVIFFRDQKISPTQHINFAKSFGEIEPPHPVYPQVYYYLVRKSTHKSNFIYKNLCLRNSTQR